jgi:hypothetical protein
VADGLVVGAKAVGVSDSAGPDVAAAEAVPISAWTETVWSGWEVAVATGATVDRRGAAPGEAHAADRTITTKQIVAQRMSAIRTLK